MRDGLWRMWIIIYVVFLSVLIISLDATAAGSGAGETDARKEVAGVLEKTYHKPFL